MPAHGPRWRLAMRRASSGRCCTRPKCAARVATRWRGARRSLTSLLCAHNASLGGAVLTQAHRQPCSPAVTTQDGFGVLGPLGNTLYMSPSMANLTGFEQRDMEGCAPQRRPCFVSLPAARIGPTQATPRARRYVYEESIVHPDDRDRVATHLRAFAARQGPAVCAMEPCPFRRLRKDGTWARLEGGGVSDVRRLLCARRARLLKVLTLHRAAAGRECSSSATAATSARCTRRRRR